MLGNVPILIKGHGHIQFSFHPRAMKMWTSVHEPVPTLWATMIGAAARIREERVILEGMIKD